MVFSRHSLRLLFSVSPSGVLHSRFKSAVTNSSVQQIYVDGSCVKSPHGFRVGGAGVFWGEKDSRNASYPLLSTLDERGNEIEVTSIRAELMAAYFAVKEAREQGYKKLTVVTDSEYVVKGMNHWIKAWMREDWRKASGGPVRNRRIFLLLWVACKQMDSVVWRHVPGHAGNHGNESAHFLAEQGSKLALSQLQKGELPNICVENDEEQLENDFVSDEYVYDDMLLDLLSSDLMKR